ncbi:MAG: DMT family transporter [Thermomonas sp.]|uniref:DMT family transporter n=1 Tax=Thermomonas sp. TaxID=1971895 RepID=UPI002623C3F1|nr:DMT family transporter [Thermomonas sp.]MCC7097595.1 DMT family transporter [Thermomonas sp.]
MSDPQLRAASLELLIGAAIIGSNGLMVRLSQMPPIAVAFWRMLLAGILLATVVSLRHRWQPLSRKAWLWLPLPILAFAVDLTLWHKSIQLVGPGLATLLANAQVFFMALAGLVLFGERLGPRFLAGVLLAFFGLWLLLGADWATLPPQYRWGVWLGLGTGVAYAAYNIGIKRSQHAAAEGKARAPVEQVLCIAAFGSALCLGLLGWAEGEVFAPPSLHAWGILLVLAAVGHCLSWVLISRSMVVLPVALAGLLLLAQPIVAYLLDVLVLGLMPTPRHWAGLMVSLLGIFVAGMKSKQPSVAQEA